MKMLIFIAALGLIGCSGSFDTAENDDAGVSGSAGLGGQAGSGNSGSGGEDSGVSGAAGDGGAGTGGRAGTGGVAGSSGNAGTGGMAGNGGSGGSSAECVNHPNTSGCFTNGPCSNGICEYEDIGIISCNENNICQLNSLCRKENNVEIGHLRSCDIALSNIRDSAKLKIENYLDLYYCNTNIYEENNLTNLKQNYICKTKENPGYQPILCCISKFALIDP